MELTKSNITTWLEKHPAIKPTVFLTECGLGRNYITQLKPGNIPQPTASKLLAVMKKYGYKPK